MREERRRDMARRELVERMRVLRSDIDTVIDHFRINCTSRVEEMLRILENREVIGDDVPGPGDEDIRRMLKALDEVKMKPRKGRLKDLKRLILLLDDLNSRFATHT
jgi:hypothetical protein